MDSGSERNGNLKSKINHAIDLLGEESVDQAEILNILTDCRQLLDSDPPDGAGDNTESQTHWLYSERLKEMQCLYAIIGVTQDIEKDHKQVLQEIVDLIPGGFTKPKATEACIEIEGKVFSTKHFRQTESLYSCDLQTSKGKAGTLAIALIDTESNGHAFLEEEKQLIEKIAGHVQSYYEHLKVRSSLKERDEYYRSMFENSPDPMFSLDTDGIFTNVNEAMIIKAECSREDLVGVHYEDFISKKDRPRIKHYFEKALKGNVSNYDVNAVTARGNRLIVNVTNVPIIIRGEVKAIHSIAKDITDIRETERLLYNTYKLARMGTWELNLIDNKLHWSSITKELHEVSPDYEPDLESALNFYKPDSRDIISQAVNDAIKQGKEFDKELQIITAKGNERWIRSVGEAEFQGDKCIRIYGSVQDIHNRKIAQQKSEQSQRLLEAILDKTESLVFIKDSESRYQLVNSEFAKVFGSTPEELLGKTPVELFGEKEGRHSRREDEKIMKSGQAIVDRNWVPTPQGRRYYFSNKFPLSDVPGMEKAIGGIVTDITSVKEVELRAQQQREAITYLATDKGLAKSNLETKLKTIARISAETLNVDEVHIWLLEDDILRCVCSYDNGEFQKLVGHTIEIGQYPNYYNELRNNRVIAIEDVYEDSRAEGLVESFIQSRNIRSLLDNSIHMSGSVMGLVGHNVIGRPRVWQQDEIMFTEAISDQVAQAFADEERKVQEAEIRDSLKEKEILLAEIHHRVKNNLAVVSSMMQLQAYKEENQKLSKKLMDSVMRIKVMASIHDHLYQSNSFSNLDFSENLKLLVSNIVETMQTEACIQTEFNCRPVSLNVNQAIPCSLIVNEVVTNSIKYAFPGKAEGKISVTLELRNQTVTLILEDDGVGLPESFNELKGKSMGVKIIEVLSEQLEADYAYDNIDNGCRFKLQFTRSDLHDGSERLNADRS